MNNDLSRYFTQGTGSDDTMYRCFSGLLSSENTVDCIIPDSVADIDSVLLCEAVPRIEEKYINAGSVYIEGTVSFNILLATEEGTLTTVNHEEPFECSANVGEKEINCFVISDAAAEKCNVRLVNPRKINIKYEIACNTEVFGYCSFKPETIGELSVEDELGIQKKYESVSAAEVSVYEKNDIEVSQDIELDSSFPQIVEIINSSIVIIPSDIKIHDGNADVRSEAMLRCIYKTADNSYCLAERKYNLQCTVEGVGEESGDLTAKAFPYGAAVKAAANSYGEMKIIELDFKYAVTLKSIRNREAVYVSDVYSVDYASSEERKTLPVTVCRRSYATNISLNTSADREEFDGKHIKSVLKGNVGLNGISAEYDKEKGRIVVTGEAVISALCENITDEEFSKQYSLKNYSHSFKCEIDSAENLFDAELYTDCYVTNIRFRADSEKIYCDFELNTRVTAYDCRDIVYVSSVEPDKTAPAEKNSAAMVLCYPTEKETLWDIAKQYSVQTDKLAEANGISDGNISDKRVLVVPVNEKSGISKKVG